MALRLTRGIDRRAEDVVALIGELVRRGEFLSHDHTRRYWKQELSLPSAVIDRDSYDEWEAKGGRTALDRARELVAAILARPEAPPAGTGDLEEIMAAEAARAGLSKLP